MLSDFVLLASVIHNSLLRVTVQRVADGSRVGLRRYDFGLGLVVFLGLACGAM